MQMFGKIKTLEEGAEDGSGSPFDESAITKHTNFRNFFQAVLLLFRYVFVLYLWNTFTRMFRAVL